MMTRVAVRCNRVLDGRSISQRSEKCITQRGFDPKQQVLRITSEDLIAGSELTPMVYEKFSKFVNVSQQFLCRGENLPIQGEASSAETGRESAVEVSKHCDDFP
jgi:hypothetical protein